MIRTDYIRAVLLRAHNSGAAAALACLFLLSPATAFGQQATTPNAPQAPPPPPQAPAALPARLKAPVAATPAARPAAPRKAPAALPAVVPPRGVVTVVHRLSGWKLLAWLATSGPPALELDEWPSPSDAHTNIVAGYVYSDGRSVITRLPQSEVELDAFAAPTAPPSFFAQAVGQSSPEPEYMLVTPEGKHVEAKFIGLDSSTGLALLEAGESLLEAEPTGDTGDTDDPAVGQRVHLYAPIPAEAPPAPAAVRTGPPAPPAPLPTDYIYLSIDQREGRLTQIVRAPSGRLSSVVVSADVSPEWVGAVAANELGEVVGIVSQSRDGETRVVPLASVREACQRVLKLRGNVPQPWLGVRGDALARIPVQSLVENGWKPEAARTLIEKRQGVVLTSVAPGTPASLAGLRPGDLIAGVGERAVRSIEDLSMLLKEAGVGSSVDLTVWRALAPQPLKLSVVLKGVKNPARATALAEEYALRASLSGSEREIREMRAAASRVRSQAADAQARAAELARISEQITVAEGRSKRLREQLEQAQALLGTTGVFSVEGVPLIVGPQARTRDMAVTTRLKTFGLHSIGLSARSAAPLGAQAGLLVVAVQPESPAAASGLLPGDVIETVNGSPLWNFDLRQLTLTPEAFTAVFGLVREGKRLSVNFQPNPTPEPRR